MSIACVFRKKFVIVACRPPIEHLLSRLQTGCQVDTNAETAQQKICFAINDVANVAHLPFPARFYLLYLISPRVT